MATKTLSISLPPGLIDYIDQEAARKFQSRSEFFKDMILDYMDQMKDLENFINDMAAEAGKDNDNGNI